MLRALIVDNFVQFRSTQILNFEEGPNFIVGANSTGKTALFELTRRCLSRKRNPKISSVPDGSKAAFAICKFELSKTLAKTIKEVITTNDSPVDPGSTSSADSDGVGQTSRFLYSGSVVLKDKLFKLVTVHGHIFISRKNLKDNFFDQTQQSIEVWSSKTPSSHAEQLSDLAKRFEDLGDLRENHQDNVTKASKNFIKVIEKFEKLSSENQESDVTIEDILLRLEAVIVVTFPVRGHGPLQWNQNPEMGKENAGYGTYKDVSDGAVILQALLDSPDVDHKEAKETFDQITISNRFEFKKVRRSPNELNEYRHQHEIDVKENGVSFPFMKVPEGILEALHFSLLLAHTKYQTICLEEPGRGMHPPMVQRMRNLLLRKQKQKTLIVISHKPSMIDFWTFDRLFMSRNDSTDNTPNHTVRRFDDSAIRRHQEETFKQMLFSSSVLFVEGPIDQVVLGAVFDEILGETDCKRTDILRLLAETNIVMIGSSTSYNPYRRLSDKISERFRHCFIFDKDSVFISKPETPLHRINNSEARKMIARACLGCPDGDEMQNLLDRNVTVTANGMSQQMKLKEYLSLSQDGPPSNDVIRTILRKCYLPKQGDAYEMKDKHIPITFDLGNRNPTNIDTYLDRQIFIWKTGNIEDVIVKGLIETRTDDGKESDIGLNLLRKIVQTTDGNMMGGGQTDQKCKDPLKKGLMTIDRSTSRELARLLVKLDEIKRLLKFVDCRLYQQYCTRDPRDFTE